MNKTNKLMNPIEPQETPRWDKKKVALGLLILFFLIGGGIYVKAHYFSSKRTSHAVQSSRNVQGASIAEVNSNSDSSNSNNQGNSSSQASQGISNLGTSVQSAVSQEINSIKQQVTNLNAQEIATSSPQIQKIINDFKSVEQYPANQAKDFCQKICGSL